ncbi:heme-copper oxidase subunit III [Natronorubrum sp. JWXQ-INN-674]|uniref:Heme-copper oxidase subunit III n=1 Tax=Natronorubrum halalkaliphilum TaxID=2691917 RepID=A0A6B0VMR6_9EURY|nr:cytochrome c oxidase subunit 3 [Natronorubrum halalkaliphilum]MXV63121.1 heme-copper oxidase subunit III [Natronorubrum halalkaliphilum]
MADRERDREPCRDQRDSSTPATPTQSSETPFRADGGGHGVSSDDSPSDPAGPAGPDGPVGPDSPHEPEAHGDHGHDEHEHRSRWPFVAALGAGGLYSGLAIVLLGAAAGVVPPVLGIAIAVTGTIVLLAGIAGWVNKAFLVPARDHAGPTKSRESYVSTTLLFLATDVSTFGALFVYYFFVRIGTWPPAELPPLLTSLVLVNTLILLASSVTIHYAHEALHDDNQRRFLGLLGTTLALGVIFLGGQVYEYYEFVVHEGFTLSEGVFGSAFFGLTGLHGIHVALGVGGIAVVFWRGLRGHYGPNRDTSVATVSLYWHFVDLVWVFLVIVLYVGAAI